LAKGQKGARFVSPVNVGRILLFSSLPTLTRQATVHIDIQLYLFSEQTLRSRCPNLRSMPPLNSIHGALRNVPLGVPPLCQQIPWVPSNPSLLFHVLLQGSVRPNDTPICPNIPKVLYLLCGFPTINKLIAHRLTV